MEEGGEKLAYGLCPCHMRGLHLGRAQFLCWNERHTQMLAPACLTVHQMQAADILASLSS